MIGITNLIIILKKDKTKLSLTQTIWRQLWCRHSQIDGCLWNRIWNWIGLSMCLFVSQLVRVFLAIAWWLNIGCIRNPWCGYPCFWYCILHPLNTNEDVSWISLKKKNTLWRRSRSRFRLISCDVCQFKICPSVCLAVRPSVSICFVNIPVS